MASKCKAQKAISDITDSMFVFLLQSMVQTDLLTDSHMYAWVIDLYFCVCVFLQFVMADSGSSFLLVFATSINIPLKDTARHPLFSFLLIPSFLSLSAPPAHFLPFCHPPHNERASWLLLIVKVAPACHWGQWLQPC